jgi:quinol monooxygenase YgiN
MTFLMKKPTKETAHMVSVLMIVGVGLVLASITSAASTHAQASNMSSAAAANNMTSATGDESITGTAGNITRAIITMEAKEGNKQEILDSLIPLSEIGRKRQGNIAYDIYASTENPNELVLDELWANRVAYDKHYNSPEASEVRETVTPLLVNPAQVKVYVEVAKIQP